MSKDMKTVTFFDEVMKSSKKLPGVGRYDLDKKNYKVHGTYTQKEPITGVIAEA